MSGGYGWWLHAWIQYLTLGNFNEKSPPPTLALTTEFFWVQLILKGRYLLKRTVFINSTNNFDNYDALLSWTVLQNCTYQMKGLITLYLFLFFFMQLLYEGDYVSKAPNFWGITVELIYLCRFTSAWKRDQYLARVE